MSGTGKWTNKRRLFVEQYLQCWNATEAARRAAYAHPRVMGPRLLKVAIIDDAIQQVLKDQEINASLVLGILRDQATATLEHFVEIDEDEGQAILDLVKAKQAGKLHLIKRLRFTKAGVEIELYSAQHAAEMLGKHLGLFTDRLDVTVGSLDAAIERELEKLAAGGEAEAAAEAAAEECCAGGCASCGE